VLTIAGPPIYSAAEYNILGRVMNYLPMHAPLNPDRVVFLFIYLGALVESLTAVGAVRLSSAGSDTSMLKNGGTFIAISATFLCVVQVLFMVTIGLMHHRCVRANMMTSKVHTVFIMLYGTSTLILIRSIFRAVESFVTASTIGSGTCNASCQALLRHEWYLYILEAAPMFVYTYWLNIVHPGKYLPGEPKIFLDFNKTERVGPGWTDHRSRLMSFLDPFDFQGFLQGQPTHDKFWLRPDSWPLSVDRNSMVTTNQKSESRNDSQA
jgi:RTA1 like protein